MEIDHCEKALPVEYGFWQLCKVQSVGHLQILQSCSDLFESVVIDSIDLSGKKS